MILRSVSLSILRAEWPKYSVQLLDHLSGLHIDRADEPRTMRSRPIDSDVDLLFAEILTLRGLWSPPNRDVHRGSDRDLALRGPLEMMIGLFIEVLSAGALEELAQELRSVLTETQWLSHIRAISDKGQGRDSSRDEQVEYADVIDRWHRTTRRLSETLGTLSWAPFWNALALHFGLQSFLEHAPEA